MGVELLRPHVETSKLADLNKDVHFNLIQLQTVLLLLLAFSSFLNISASTPGVRLLVGALSPVNRKGLHQG